MWQIGVLLPLWKGYIEGLPGWQYHEHEGYRAVSVDITAFFRPQLKACPSKHYYAPAGKALPAVIIGMIGVTGSLNGQRLAVPRDDLRVTPKDPSEKSLQTNLLKQVYKKLAEDEAAIMDAGFKLKAVQATGLKRYVLRLAKNFTARKNKVMAYQGTGRRPVYGEWVRPLARTYAGHEIAATAPDEIVTWQEGGHEIRAELWTNLILPGVVPDPDHPTFKVVAIYDPRYNEPWLLATDLPIHPATVKALYHDRWPIEQNPLSAKQMVGAHRQFVFAQERIQRLPELALLAGSIQSFLAASMPVMPTGFWDRNPRRTPGRLRRALFGRLFPSSFPLPARIRKKNSATDHLPKGMLGHRRKAAQNSS